MQGPDLPGVLNPFANDEDGNHRIVLTGDLDDAEFGGGIQLASTNILTISQMES